MHCYFALHCALHCSILIVTTTNTKEESFKIMQKEECIELVKSFIAEKLNGNIWNFLNYDLALLENDEKYGGYDPDNSKIANAIYFFIMGR